MQDQNLHSQIGALAAVGASRSFADELTGKNAARPGLEACLDCLCDDEDDVLLVYSTDRLGRSMTDLVSVVGMSQQLGTQFRSVTEPFNTATASGELFSASWSCSRR